MFYSDNLLLSVLARSCKESAVALADAYHISSFDLLHLDSSGFKNVFWDYFFLLLLLICDDSISWFLHSSLLCLFFEGSF